MLIKKITSSLKPVCKYYLSLKGIGWYNAKKLCAKSFVSKTLKHKQIRRYLRISSRFRFFNKKANDVSYYGIDSKSWGRGLFFNNKDRLQFIIKCNSVRSYLHYYGLPVRGQRTRTNRYTQRQLSRYRMKGLVRF